MTTAAAQNNRPIQEANGDFSPVAGRLGPAGCSGFLRSPGRFAGSSFEPGCSSVPGSSSVPGVPGTVSPGSVSPGSVSPPTTVSGPSTIVPGTVFLLSGGFVPGVVPEPGSVVPPPPEPGPSGSGRSGSGLKPDLTRPASMVRFRSPWPSMITSVQPSALALELRVRSLPAPLIVNL